MIGDPAIGTRIDTLLQHPSRILWRANLPAGHVVDPVDLDELQIHFESYRTGKRRFSTRAENSHFSGERLREFNLIGTIHSTDAITERS